MAADGEELCRSEVEQPPSKEPFVGNLSKCIPLPPDRLGDVRRGDLQFDSCFEGGNLGRVDYISDYEYDLFIRPDTCNPRYRVWFNFTVQNVCSDQRVIFNIVNFSKTKSLYRDGMSPLVKSTSRPNWERIPHKNVFYYRCPDHQKNYVLSFAFAFDREDDVYQFAYCYPYTYTRLQLYLEGLDKRNLDYYKRELLCHSVQQRSLDLLTISSPCPSSSSPRKMVFITGRVHPGETPSSFVCQGLIEYLLSDDPGAKVLRKHIVFKIVPMLNPDGVYLGNYRCSLMGFDLNRHWHAPSPWAHPTLHATKQLVMQYDQDWTTDLDFYIDIHAHSTLTNGFMYGNMYEDEERFERQAVFPKLLARYAEDFSWSKTSFNKDAVKAGTGRSDHSGQNLHGSFLRVVLPRTVEEGARAVAADKKTKALITPPPRFLGGCLTSQTQCYTLEVSFFSYTTSQTHAPYTEEAYLSLGRNVARTFLHYYNLDNLQFPPPSTNS